MSKTISNQLQQLSFENLFTLNRNCKKSQFDKDLNFSLVDINKPSINYLLDPTGGVLLEPDSNNILRYSWCSEDNLDTYWYTWQCNLSQGNTYMNIPFRRIERDDSESSFFVASTAVGNAGHYGNSEKVSISFLVKLDDPDNYYLVFKRSANRYVDDRRYHITFDLSSEQEIYRGSVCDTTQETIIKHLKNNIYYISFTLERAMPWYYSTFGLSIMPKTENPIHFNNTTGATPAGVGFEFALPQIENNKLYSSSYIYTNGAETGSSTVERYSDKLYINNLFPWFNQDKGTLEIEYNILRYPDADPRWLFEFFSQTNNSVRLFIRDSNLINNQAIYDYGSDQIPIYAYDILDPVKDVITWESGNIFRYSVNKQYVGDIAVSTFEDAFDSLSIGINQSGNYLSDIVIKKIKFHNYMMDMTDFINYSS